MQLGTIAILVGIAASIITSVIAILGVVRIKIKEAEDRGAMSERYDDFEEDLNHAHDKIRSLAVQLNETDKEIVDTRQQVRGLESKIDDSNRKLDQLINMHMQGSNGH